MSFPTGGGRLSSGGLVLCFLACSHAGENATLHIFDPASYPVARCLDGSVRSSIWCCGSCACNILAGVSVCFYLCTCSILVTPNAVDAVNVRTPNSLTGFTCAPLRYVTILRFVDLLYAGCHWLSRSMSCSTLNDSLWKAPNVSYS